MNIVYNASAGTGKTFQVTRLYEELVLNEAVDPRDILLMTFTENAAAELRTRVSHRLLKARRDAEKAGNDDLADRAVQAQAHLPSAPIGTIHAYCTRLLRENALEAGLSPGFTIIQGEERDELLNRIVRTELLERLESDPAFNRFCAGVHLIASRKGFGSSLTETVPQLISEAGSLGISLEEAESLLPEPLPPVDRSAFEGILQELKDLPRKTKKIEQAIAVLEEALETQADPVDIVTFFDVRFSGHFSYGEAKTIYPRFKELKIETLDRIRYRERHRSARAFAAFVQAVVRRFQAQKHAVDALDFDDLLRMARDLLTRDLAEPTFRYVIVDEVQDTSRIQCDLIEALWTEETHLVICGDKKQSIYTWRGADPQVMPDLQRAILDREQSRLENLQTSYRSKEPVLDVVNALFDTVYDTEFYGAGDRLRPNPDYAVADEKPCVEFLTWDGDESDPKTDRVSAEMKAVADRIQLLVGDDPAWRPTYRYHDGFSPSDAGNRYRYADILILLKRTTHQPLLEEALRHANIPYTLGGRGRGLFTRQETRDVSLFLNVLTQPKDAYSLVGFLRSPWIGLSDEALAELAWDGQRFSEEHLLQRYPEATDCIDRYRTLLGTKLASELVRMLIDETGYDALLAGLPRGTQRLANLRKVLDWLRETERGARQTPATTARHLARCIAEAHQVPEAALLDPASNAVTIMTVHGAKGLTKNVVFIPDTAAGVNADRSFARLYFDDSHQPALGLKITDPDRTSVKSPGFDEAMQAARAVRDQEQRNLFYVAMTRARDLVILSATAGEKPAGWYPYLEPLIADGRIASIPYQTLADAVTPPHPSRIRIPSEQRLKQTLQAVHPPVRPPAFHRLPATRLARENDELEPEPDAEEHRIRGGSTSAALGSLGHAVLEQLALNGWAGEIRPWLERLCGLFEVPAPEARTLQQRLEQTRDLMQQQTAGLANLRPEFPFVLHEDDQLIDGTIDLLGLDQPHVHLFDYKFSEDHDEHLTEQYQGQMAVYARAARRIVPDVDTVRCSLVVVSAGGPRLLPILF